MTFPWVFVGFRGVSRTFRWFFHVFPSKNTVKQAIYGDFIAIFLWLLGPYGP